MRAVMFLLLLVGAAFAGCLGAEDAPEHRHTCRSCPVDPDPDGDGLVELGPYTWSDEHRGITHQTQQPARVHSTVLAFSLPSEAGALEIIVTRHLEPAEAQPATLRLCCAVTASATFETHDIDDLGAQQQAIIQTGPADADDYRVDYWYDRTNRIGHHDLEIEVIGHLR